MEIAACPSVPPLVRIGRYAEAHPLLFGAALSASKTTAADLAVQFGLEGKSITEWDAKRTAVFSVFGFGFMGIAQYFLIARLPAYVFPSSSLYAAKTLAEKARDLVGTRNLILQVAWDQLVVMPTLFLPAYYTIKTLALSPEESASQRILDGLKSWRSNIWEDINASWMIWVPAQLINFGFVPMHFRIPFVALVSTLYTAVLSYTRGQDPETKLGVEQTMDGICAQTCSPRKRLIGVENVDTDWESWEKRTASHVRRRPFDEWSILPEWGTLPGSRIASALSTGAEQLPVS
jgi:protein Mpv17